MSGTPLLEGVKVGRRSSTSTGSHAHWRRRLPWWAEFSLVVIAYELYNLVQALTAGDLAEARSHGVALERLERRLHIWIEPAVNRVATAHSWLAIGCGYYYALAHVVVTFAVLVFLWRRRPDDYAVLRNGLIALSLAGLLVFWLWPVGPPRLVIPGFSDILARHNILGAAHVHGGLVNVYASMPSLHVAWASWCAGAIAYTNRSRWRYLAWLYPAATVYVVLATANHYLLDAMAGGVLTAAAFMLMNVSPTTPRRGRTRRAAG